MSVGLVVVSHSAKVAEGVVELAGQMAPDVRIRAAGGTDDGDGVLVLVEFGSAVLSAQLAVDELVGEARRGRVRISNAPLVEGAVVGAVQASTGSDLDEVDQAATETATMAKVKDDRS